MGEEPEVGVSALAVPWTWCGFQKSLLPSPTCKMTRGNLLSFTGCRVHPRPLLLSGSVTPRGTLSAGLGASPAPTSYQL